MVTIDRRVDLASIIEKYRPADPDGERELSFELVTSYEAIPGRLIISGSLMEPHRVELEADPEGHEVDTYFLLGTGAENDFLRFMPEDSLYRLYFDLSDDNCNWWMTS